MLLCIAESNLSRIKPLPHRQVFDYYTLVRLLTPVGLFFVVLCSKAHGREDPQFKSSMISPTFWMHKLGNSWYSDSLRSVRNEFQSVILFCHDRSLLTNSLDIVFPVKNLILYFIRGQFDSISWLTTSIFPTIFLTYGRVVTFSYGPFNFSEPDPVSHPTDKGGRPSCIPTIFQTLLPKGRP